LHNVSRMKSADQDLVSETIQIIEWADAASYSQ